MRLLFTAVLVVGARLLWAQVVEDQSFQLVNSAYDEQAPLVSPDGNTLYFTIGNHPQNIGGKKDPGDIWFSSFSDGQWSAPVHGGPHINDRAYNAVAAISADGTKLFLHGHYDASGNPAKTQGIAVASRDGHGWNRPVNISIPYFQNKSGTACGDLSADGNVFVFSAETYGTLGVDDIYVSLKVNGQWTAPRNAGPGINTQFQELSPSISADGKSLYFSSNGRKGSGSFDVYSASRLDDSWTSWSAPQNMGTAINSSGRELYFRTVERGYSIYTSTINSDGYGDIRVYRPAELPSLQVDTAIVAGPAANPKTVVATTATPYPEAPIGSGQVRVYGKIVNSKTGEPVNATIVFMGLVAGNQPAAAAAGQYAIIIDATEQYNVVIEAQGFISTMEALDINTYEMKELEMNFSLQPVEIGTTVNLKNVLFAQTKTDILPESYRELDLVVNFLKTNPNVRIELAGHTDNRGIHADNIKLSQQRVNRVKEYLVLKGVDAKRISGKGYGGTRPITSNDTEQSRKMNRRVEFTIKKL